MPKIRDLLKEGEEMLGHAGVADDRLTATLLLAHLLSKDRTYLFVHNDEEVPVEIVKEFHRATARRAQGEPLQYITGHQEFYGRDFLVTPAVLIPRPETELLVEHTLKLAAASKLENPRILDIGSGSGCIAVTLAAELQLAVIFALDISTAALAIAKQNAAKNNLSARINWLCSDLCSAIWPQLPDNLKFDFCCANPPYVDPQDRERLAREVKDHEPHLALFAPEQGLALIKQLIKECAQLTRDGGYLLCEIGYGQEDQVLSGVDNKAWQPVETLKDLQGIPRTIVLKRINHRDTDDCGNY